MRSTSNWPALLLRPANWRFSCISPTINKVSITMNSVSNWIYISSVTMLIYWCLLTRNKTTRRNPFDFTFTSICKKNQVKTYSKNGVLKFHCSPAKKPLSHRVFSELWPRWPSKCHLLNTRRLILWAIRCN